MMLVSEQSIRLVPLTSPHAPGCSRAAARSSLCHHESPARITVLPLKKPVRLLTSTVSHAALSFGAGAGS